jgi:hypothetical protein
MGFEVVHVDVLALVGLVRVAFYGFSLAVLARDDVLVAALLVKTIPLFVVVVAGLLVVCPCSLFGQHPNSHRKRTNMHTSFASIMALMT